MPQTLPEVDTYIENEKAWQPELRALRKIVLACGLTETLKWRTPCYTSDNRNIVMIAALKDGCALSFFNGALLKDPDGLLASASKNIQAARFLKFTSVKEITNSTDRIKAYIAEAIANENAGLKVTMKKTADFDVPEEFQTRLDADPALDTAFAALTPGRQRGYLLHFSSAKQSVTRAARVEKYAPLILAGKGIHDCTCDNS